MCGEEAFSYRHPERSRGIFFVCRVPFPVWNGLHEIPFLGGAGSTVFPACRSSHILCLAANEKDFSLSLEMTNVRKRHSRIESHLYEESVKRPSTSFQWKEAARRGGGWLSPRYEREYEESGLSYRHPERSRGIFFVCRVLFPAWSGLHETPFFRGVGSRVFPACRSSHSLCLPANEKDFSLSLEITNTGERYSRIESHLHVELVKRHSPSFPWKEVPRRGGGWLSQRDESRAGGSGILVS